MSWKSARHIFSAKDAGRYLAGALARFRRGAHLRRGALNARLHRLIGRRARLSSKLRIWTCIAVAHWFFGTPMRLRSLMVVLSPLSSLGAFSASFGAKSVPRRRRGFARLNRRRQLLANPSSCLRRMARLDESLRRTFRARHSERFGRKRGEPRQNIRARAQDIGRSFQCGARRRFAIR